MISYLHIISNLEKYLFPEKVNENINKKILEEIRNILNMNAEDEE